MIAIAPNEGMAKQLASDTVKKNDTLLFMVDLHSAYGPFERATGTAVAPVDGLPTVKLAKNGAPTITMPKTAAPTIARRAAAHRGRRPGRRKRARP